jgi:hypothetical protein
MTSIQTAIIDLMTAHPTLSSAGLHFRCRDKNWNDREYLKTCRAEMLTERFLKGVSLCEDYIGQHGIKRGHSSYWYKHVVESQHKSTYIHNGAFIVAAIICGYVPVLHPTPNPSFRKVPKPRAVKATPPEQSQ